jgi:transcriptional/translational regulatory protein YebC/TACO1
MGQVNKDLYEGKDEATIVNSEVSEYTKDDGTVVVYTEVADLNNAKKALENAFPGITFEIDEISYFANDTVKLNDEDKAKFERLLEMLDDLDDVSNVYHNVEL